VFSEDDKQLLQQVRKLQVSEINKYLDRNSPFSGIWEKHHPEQMAMNYRKKPRA